MENTENQNVEEVQETQEEVVQEKPVEPVKVKPKHVAPEIEKLIKRAVNQVISNRKIEPETKVAPHPELISKLEEKYRKIEERERKTKENLRKSTVEASLTKFGVQTGAAPVLLNYHLNNVKFKTDEDGEETDELVAIDGEYELPIDSYFKTYFSLEENQIFLKSPARSGSGEKTKEKAALAVKQLTDVQKHNKSVWNK